MPFVGKRKNVTPEQILGLVKCTKSPKEQKAYESSSAQLIKQYLDTNIAGPDRAGIGSTMVEDDGRAWGWIKTKNRGWVEIKRRAWNFDKGCYVWEQISHLTPEDERYDPTREMPQYNGYPYKFVEGKQTQPARPDLVKKAIEEEL